MSLNRYEPENGTHKATEFNHFNRFFKKVKNRQLKRQSAGEIPTNTIKRNKPNETLDGTNQKDLSLLNSSTVPNLVSESFTVIGGHDFSKSNKVKALLPKWLAQPELIPTDLLSKMANDFPKFKHQILLNLKKNKVPQLFPVQRVTIPWIVKQSHKSTSLNCIYVPQDVCVSSPTGSGKTLAYVLPVIQGLINRLVPRIRCLVVVPVQELAVQVGNVFQNYIKGTNLRVEIITGGKAMLQVEQDRLLKKIKGQNDTYESLVDIVVVTPGRLVEHLQKTKGFNLRNLKYLVVDEADRMMDGIQNDWLFYLEKHLGQELFPSLSLNYIRKRRILFQKLLFSATLSYDPEKLKKLNLFQPVLFTSGDNRDSAQSNIIRTTLVDQEESLQHVGKFLMPQELEEFYIVVESYFKPLVIAELLSAYKWRMVLCFCKSASEAHRLSKLVELLCSDLKVKDISANLNKTSRNLVLRQFSNGEIDMLVSSDVMARGIDIPKVKYVISYDPPKHLRGYVHRAGRTGRAGAHGTVLTLTSLAQVTPFTQKLQSNRIDVSEMKMNPEVLQKRTEDFKIALKKLRDCAEDLVRNIAHVVKSRDVRRRKKKIK